VKNGPESFGGMAVVFSTWIVNKLLFFMLLLLCLVHVCYSLKLCLLKAKKC
jgi:hypothetical protein